MKDATLEVSGYLPAAGGANVVGPLDLHVDGDSYGNTWRLGRIRATIPAMPNFVAGGPITLTMQQQPAAGGAYANTQPIIQASVAAVAVTGSAATTIDFPLPPNLTGPVQFAQSVPGGSGNNTGVLITYDWLNE